MLTVVGCMFCVSLGALTMGFVGGSKVQRLESDLWLLKGENQRVTEQNQQLTEQNQQLRRDIELLKTESQQSDR